MNQITGQIGGHQQHGSRLWLIAALGALLLLALGQRPASAAPMLTADDNPIPIYSPATSGNTMIRWSGLPAPPEKAALYYDGAVQAAAGQPIPVSGNFSI